jgi:hypothetical protein
MEDTHRGTRACVAGVAITTIAALVIGVQGAAAADPAVVTQGEFRAFATSSDPDITGRATMVRTADGKTIVTVGVRGLAPSTSYGTHVHARACADGFADGHYKHDPAGPGAAERDLAGVHHQRGRRRQRPGDGRLAGTAGGGVGGRPCAGWGEDRLRRPRPSVLRSGDMESSRSLPAATRAASLPSLAAGLLWVAAWLHLLMAHGTSQVNEQRMAFGLTWLDSGRLVAPSLILAVAAAWLLARESRHTGTRLAASVAVVGLLVAGVGATLGFWTQPVGTYEGASRESGVAAIGGLLAMLGSGLTAVGLVAMGIGAARVRLLSGWVALLLPLAGLSIVPWLHESPSAIGFGIAWIGVGGWLAMAGRDGPAGRRWPSRPRVLPDWKRWAGRLAGAFALASGLAYIGYFLLDASVRDVAITAWNLLIIPGALYLGLLTARGEALLAAAATAAGIAASVL